LISKLEQNIDILEKLSNSDLVHLLTIVFKNINEDFNISCSKVVLGLILENKDILTIMNLTIDVVMLNED